MSRVLVLLLLLVGTQLPAESLQLAVIVHPSVTVDTLEKSQLLDYYACDIQRWPDGEPVVVTDLKEKGAVRDRFYRFLGTRPSRMKSIWLRKMLSGEADPPEAMASEAAMLHRVAQTPGALGFVRHTSVTDSVRVLMLIDLEPADTQDSR